MEKAVEETSWAELLGSKNWEGLLLPLDLSLRQFILRCGDFCQVGHDAFNNDSKNKYAGASRYGKKTIFNKVYLQSASRYQVFCFLYATADGFSMLTTPLSDDPWDRKSNFMGYIATTTDEVSKASGRREIYVVWRGTETTNEFSEELNPFLTSAKQLLRPEDHETPVPQVNNAWLKIYVSSDPESPFTKLSARQQLQRKIQQLLEMYKGENLSIVVTGHSLGASLSVLSAFDLVENGVTDIPVSAIVLACPMVGDKVFSKRVSGFANLKILHIKNKYDIVPDYPSFIFGYADVGKPLVINNDKSAFLKKSLDYHNLQAMLHVVAGWNGDDGDFELKVKRCLALVNKISDHLKDEYMIVAAWWVEKNKGLVCDENGEWTYAPPSEEDLPVVEF